MIIDAATAPSANGTPTGTKPIERSIILASDPGTRIHLRLTVLAASLTLFLTSAVLDAGQTGSSMGSLVYAMPDVSAMYSSGTRAMLTSNPALQPKPADQHTPLHHPIYARLRNEDG